MPYFTAQELQLMQKTLGIRLDKSRGQCYLIDKNILNLIIEYAKLDPQQDRIIEIGAGLGILSDYLIQNSAQVFLVENDRKIANFLYSNYHNHFSCEFIDLSSFQSRLLTQGLISRNKSKVIILFGDALKIPFPSANRVVANIPYQISAPILFKMIENWHYSQVNLMVQAEFADRLIASVNSSSYSRLSASVGLFLDVHIDHIVQPTSFFPRPRILSKLITLHPKPPQFVAGFNSWENKKIYLSFLQGIFPYKNKTLRNAIRIWMKHHSEIKSEFPYFHKICSNPEKFPGILEKVRNISPKTLFSWCIYGKTGELEFEDSSN
ncbi:MAG: ribosomal RNA small subunit methyltransferase A [Promethearchaeia archaeon]|nr:MAG: ribosomal RNA small subunit methyltransferase A [Candidatus Lokiarchaeia archaeon]